VEDGRSAWPSVNLYVQADDFQGGKYKGQTGIIREVVSGADSSCMVAFGNDVVYLSGNVLQRVQPEKKDAVMILQGDWKGFTGTLIGIDRHDGIVKISKNSDIRIEPLSNLAKYLAT
jgi:transcription elongation factor SPT5